MRRAGRVRQDGFTLLEILVALVVLGFLLAGLGQGARFGLRAWDSQERLLAGQGDADAVDRVLRRLIEQADPGRATIAAKIDGGAAALSLVTVLSGPGRSNMAETALGVDAGKRLVLRWSPYLSGTRLLPPAEPVEQVLLANVDRLEIAYWGPDPGKPDTARSWHSSWRGPDLPDLIRIRLIFGSGDTRRWPPIVAAPMRAK